MVKFFKVFGSIVGACLLIVAVGTVALVTLVDPNDYKNRIAEEVRKRTGRTMEFTGDITLSYFPWLGLETGAVRMANPDSFGGGDFMSLDRAGIQIKLMPLLKKDVQVSFVTIEGLKLNFIRNAKGEVNWEFTPEPPVAAAGTGAAHGAAPAAAPSAVPKDVDGFADDTVGTPLETLPALLVDSFAITRADITFTDEQAGTTRALKDLSLATSAITLGKPVDLTIKTKVESNIPRVESDVDFHTNLMLAHDLTRIELDNQTLNVDAKGSTFPGGSLSLRQQGAMSYDLMQQVFSVRSFTANAYDADLNASGKLSLAESPVFHGKVAVECTLRDTLKALGMELKTADASVLDKAALSFTIAASPVQVALSNINGTLDDTAFSGAVRIRQFARPEVKAELAVTALDADRYMPLAADDKAEETPSAKDNKAEADKNNAPAQNSTADTADKAVSDKTGKAGTTATSGTGTAKAAAKDSKPAAAPAKAAPAQSGKPAATAGTEKTDREEPFISAEARKALRKLLLDASLKVGEFTIQKIHLTDMDIKATAKDGIFKVSPCSANIFEGRYDAEMTADIRNRDTRSSFSLNAKNLQVAPITATFMGEPRATGTANWQTNLYATGDTVQEVLASLNGKGSFAVTDGAVLGVQIVPDKAKAEIKNSKVDKTDDAVRKQTFERLSGTYTVRSGRITNKDLALVSPSIKGSGAGYVDLYQDKIEYKAVARITGMPKIPVTVTGTLSNPRYEFDARALLKSTFKNLESLLPIPGLTGDDAGTQKQDGSKDEKKPKNPLEQLGKGLQQLFQQ
ncbi:MAG: AsmA family protein [Halodesulfovibrio sp.]